MFNRLKEKWGIESNFQILLIIIVFSLTGMSVVWARKLIWQLFGFTPDTSSWIKVPTYIALIFPMYQFMLIIYGTLFGQFKFFWAKEKAMFGRMFGRKKR